MSYKPYYYKALEEYRAALQLYNVAENVQEVKLLLQVVKHLSSSIRHTKAALLQKNGTFCNPQHENISTAFSTTFPSFPISSPLHQYEALLQKQEAAPMSFVRKQQLVVCNENYNMDKLDFTSATLWLEKAKVFIDNALPFLLDE